MPELPEVELVAIQAAEYLVGKTVRDVITYSPKLRAPIPDLSILIGQKLIRCNRRSKYIVLTFELNTVIIHLGMTGQFRLKNTNEKLKHDHILFRFENVDVVYNDTRRFGLVNLYKNSDNISEFTKLGIEPLSPDLTLETIKKVCKSNKKIKEVLLNPQLIVGIGNAYASEILFDSKILPIRKASDLSDDELNILMKSIIKILNNGIAKGGISMKDYVHFDGTKGVMQDSFVVYKRDNCKCLNCNELIKSEFIGGRNSFYCPNCQK